MILCSVKIKSYRQSVGQELLPAHTPLRTVRDNSLSHRSGFREGISCIETRNLLLLHIIHLIFRITIGTSRAPLMTLMDFRIFSSYCFNISLLIPWNSRTDFHPIRYIIHWASHPVICAAAMPCAYRG